MHPLAGLFVNLGLGLALAGGLIYSSVVVTKSFEKSRSAIDVKGYAERKVDADYATWEIYVVARDQDLSRAYATLEKHKEKTVSFLHNVGFKDVHLQVGPVSKMTIYKRDDNGNQLPDGMSFEMRQSISLTTSELETLKNAALSIAQLGTEGVDVDVMPPSYLIKRENLEKIKIDLLAEATKSARERANQFAQNSGTTIGRLVSARQGVFQVTSEHSTDVNDYGTYDTSSPIKIIKIVVTLSYTTDKD